MMYNMDKLYEAVAERGHVCVGLDTAPEYIPEKELAATTPAEAVLAFNKAIIDASIDIAACFKVQIAYYEEMGLAGLKAYAQTLKYIRERKALVITDIKRSDIADTASRYARAHFEGDFEADFVTLSPYLGMDSLEPWLEWADKKGKGAFVLMRTSNKGRHDFQLLPLGGGSTPLASAAANAGSSATPPRLFNAVGDRLSELAASHRGIYGYGAFGAVVGIDSHSEDERRDAVEIRSKRADLFFLIPGYGAQGGAASDAALLLAPNGNGGIVNASRSILLAWKKFAERENREAASITLNEVSLAAREAAIDMRDAILDAVKK